MGIFHKDHSEYKDNWHKEEFPEYHDSLTNRIINYTLLSYKYFLELKNKLTNKNKL